jgi:hypothetical protein
MPRVAAYCDEISAQPPPVCGASGTLLTMFTAWYSVNMAIRHKHLKLNQRKIDQARRALGTKTEQETLDRALDMVLAEQRIVRILRRGKAIGGFEDVFRRR